MTKPLGRPAKYQDHEKTMWSVFMPPHFRDTNKDLIKLSAVDKDPDFLRYCQDIEEVDLDKLKESKASIYARWILTKHRIQNMHKLGGIE